MSPHSQTLIYTPLLQYLRLSPSTFPPTRTPTHTHQLPLQTPNHAIIGKESHCNQHNLLSSYHTKGKKIKKGTPVHHSTLHCTLKPSLAPWREAGWGREEGSRQIFPVIPLLRTSPVLWPSSGPLLVRWSAGSREQPWIGGWQ